MRGYYFSAHSKSKNTKNPKQVRVEVSVNPSLVNSEKISFENCQKTGPAKNPVEPDKTRGGATPAVKIDQTKRNEKIKFSVNDVKHKQVDKLKPVKKNKMSGSQGLMKIGSFLLILSLLTALTALVLFLIGSSDWLVVLFASLVPATFAVIFYLGAVVRKIRDSEPSPGRTIILVVLEIISIIVLVYNINTWTQ